MQPVHVTLREVVRIFCVRIGSEPIKARYKEEQHDHMRHSVVLNAELVYGKLARDRIKAAMKGLVFRDAQKGTRITPWKEQIRWTYEGKHIKFQVTCRIYKDGQHTFSFSTLW